MNAALQKELVCDIFKEEKIVMKILKKKNMLVNKLLLCRDSETPADCPRVNQLLYKQLKISRTHLSRYSCYAVDPKI